MTAATNEAVTTRYAGTRVARVEDNRLLAGRSTFVDDVVRPGMLHDCFVRSPFARATINGIDISARLGPARRAMRECHGLQCDFCTPGLVTSITAMLRDNPRPTDDEIREGLSGNFCRCTGYQGIVNAVHLAAEKLQS